MGQDNPVTEQTPGENNVDGLPRFNVQDFDDSLYVNGYKAYLEKAIKCPCTLKENGSAIPECRNCGGVGWTWINKRYTTILMQNINRPTKFQNWSEEDRGTVSISARDEDRLSFMDRITLIDLQAGYTEVRKSFTAKNKTYVSLTYYPIQIEFVFLFQSADKGYKPLVYGTDYLVSKYNIELLGELRNRKEPASIGVRYLHNPQYCVVDIIREQSASRGSVEQPCGLKDPEVLGKHPVHSIGKKSHYLFDKPNVYDFSLIDNSTPEDGTVIAVPDLIFCPAPIPMLTCENLSSCSTFQSLQILVEQAQSTLTSHLQDLDNPHEVTAAQTGAPTILEAQEYADSVAQTAEDNSKSYTDSVAVGLLNDRGNHDASTNLFPSSGGSGAAGAIKKGNLWFISVAGTLGGQAVTVGDSVRALVDNPMQVASNWNIMEVNITYVPVNKAGDQLTGAVVEAENSIALLDINWSLGGSFYKTIEAASTFTFSGLSNGQTISIALVSDAIGGFLISWPVGIIFLGGLASTQTILANKSIIYSFTRKNGIIYCVYQTET